MSFPNDTQSDPFLSSSNEKNGHGNTKEEIVESTVENGQNCLRYKTNKSRRLDSIDLLRGFIMAIMAWDHSKDSLSSYSGNDQHAVISPWAGHYNMFGGQIGYFLLRGVSHICAAGFSYLMGVGMALLTSSRRRKNWTSLQILKFFELRGAVLVVFGFVVRGANLMYMIDVDDKHRGKHVGDYLLGFWQVMTSLGLQMMVSAWWLVPLEKYKSKSFFSIIKIKKIHPFFEFSIFSIFTSIFAFFCFAFTAVIIHYRQHGNPSATELPKEKDFLGILWTFLVVPGYFGDVSENMYPVIPWLGFCLFGMCAAHELSTQPKLGHFRHLINGTIFLILFLILRLVGGGGVNLRGWPLNEGRDISEFISFFHVCKYPPSVTFFLVTIGFDSILLYIFHKISQWAQNPLAAETTCQSPKNSSPIDRGNHTKKIILFFLKVIRAYGRTPLIFYVVHFYWIKLIRVFFYYAIEGSKGPGGIPLGYVALVWFFIVLPSMYPLCIKYGQFKNKTSPNSLWRLF